MLNLFILILFILLFVIILSIYFSLILTKRIKTKREYIESVFNNMVYEFFSTNSIDHLYELEKLIKSKSDKNFMIEILNKNKKLQAIDQVMLFEQLYISLHLHDHSYKKLNSFLWYVKARGIKELYSLNCDLYLDNILQLTTHKNVYVRREAQIASIVFQGWQGLHFLEHFNMNISLWQQSRLIEFLYKKSPVKEVEVLNSIIEKANDFTSELVIRIITKYKYRDAIDFVTNKLNHPDPHISNAAVRSLCILHKKNEFDFEYFKYLYNNKNNTEETRNYVSEIYMNLDIQNKLQSLSDVVLTTN